jgi:uncharacterized protein YprB with RNaseH-like and TPR domain
MELRERLRLALGAGTAANPTATPASRPAELANTIAALPGLRAVPANGGTVYLTDQSWPLAHGHGRLPLGDALGLSRAALSRLAPSLKSKELARAAYVDVETTGLAGGTGTYVFLTGIGTFEEESFRVRQFFLADLAGEHAMLTAIRDILAERPALVSFNGRRFDLPLIATRLTLNQLPPLPDVRHLDLLYPARRLYQRRLPSCRLGELEERLLGFTREDDVPGWVVPSLYIEYMHTGRADPLRAVFHHNALDILSLAALLSHLGHVVGGTFPADGEDYVALARWDEAEGRLADAASAYDLALQVSDEGAARSTARGRLAHLYRRQSRLEEAARLWREETESGGPVEGRLAAMVEVAKLEEHRWRRYAEAETLTRRALSLLEVETLRRASPMHPQLRREALEHRLQRLIRRQAAGRMRLGNDNLRGAGARSHRRSEAVPPRR